MNENIKKSILNTAIAKVINDNITENDIEISFNVLVKDHQIDIVKNMVENKTFDFLKPINITMLNRRLKFSVDKNDIDNIYKLKRHFVKQSNLNGCKLFNLEYDDSTIMGYVSAKMIEDEIKNLNLDLVLDSENDYCIEESSIDSFYLNVISKGKKDRDLTFSIYKDDPIVHLLNFIQKTNQEYKTA